MTEDQKAKLQRAANDIFEEKFAFQNDKQSISKPKSDTKENEVSGGLDFNQDQVS